MISVVLLSFFSFLGAANNGFAMFVLLRMKSVLKKNPNKFLLPLVTGQLLLTLIVIPYRIHHILSVNYYNTNCRWNIGKRYINSLVFISAVSNGCIAYDRYLHVELNHSYHNKMKGVLMYILLALPWLTTLTYLISLTFGDALHYITVIVITVWLFFTLLFCYSKMINTLRYQYKYMANVHVARAIRKMHNQKIIHVSLWILISELTCALPGLIYLLCGFVYIVSSKTWSFWIAHNIVLEEAANVFYLFSVCLNPVLYLNRNKDFKRYMCKAFRRRNEIHPSSNDLHPAKRRSKTRFIPRTPHMQDREDFKMVVYPLPGRTSELLATLDRRKISP